MPVVNETVYHVDTPHEVIRVLESARQSKRRVRLHYGDVATGRDWLCEYDVRGTIGRSSGTVKVPILLANARSIGGGALLDHCIVQIRDAKTGQVLYRHPTYHYGNISLTDSAHAEYQFQVCREGVPIARFSTEKKAEKYLRELGIENYLCYRLKPEHATA